MDAGKWMYNFGESETWINNETFESKQQAIDAGMNHEDFEDFKLYGDNLYVGQLNAYPIPENYVNVDHILDSISESIYDEYGEISEDYLDDVFERKREAYDDLEKEVKLLVGEWLDAYKLRPTFSNLINVEQITNFKVKEVD